MHISYYLYCIRFIIFGDKMEDIKIKEIFENIYEVDLGDGLKRIATKSIVKGKKYMMKK